MSTPQHTWTTPEMTRIKEQLAAGWTYDQIADDLGLTPHQVQAAARRNKLTKPERCAWHARDWSEIDPIIRDCLEARCMSICQVVDYLAIGHLSSYCGVRSRVLKMPANVQRRARKNGQRRVIDNAHRMRMRVKRAA